MDPAMQPINGISLERYADLGAAVSDIMDDPEAIRKVLAEEGVAEADFEAAKTGWTARMQDMSLMGRIAMAYQPLYQAAVARRKGGLASMAYEDYVHASAAMKVFGYEAGLAACGISQADWTEAAGQWTTKMSQNMGQYAGHHPQVDQQAAAMSGGAAPRKIQITRVAGATQDAQPAAVQAAINTPGASGMDVAMAQVANDPHLQQHAQQQAAIQANPLGFVGGQVGALFTGGIMAGSNVMVQWSDGNSYPGKVMQAGQGQHMVQFQNGSQQWVPEQYLKKA